MAARGGARVRKARIQARKKKAITPYRKVVSSTCLRRVEHDGESTLRVEFRKGSVYDYFDVDREVAPRTARASSVGRYYNRHIRNAGYDYELVRAGHKRRGAKGKR